ncbi:MAG: glycoside hydrolase family 15 [Candidatus Symbiothrix sp.]|jgi:hypothetical protein|nr:glycoside hydrolase family 15 [Candidatus Symbiothrix sp.]
MATEKLYDVWARRNPNFETHFEESLLREFTDYGIGASELTSAKGKILGAGYELYIFAFFLGLYAEQKRELQGEYKSFGQPIQFWGNLESKKGRKAYPKIREYIFAALVARTEIDFIALEKGDITVRKAVDFLIDTMEQYTNYGFYMMLDKLKVNPNYFYKTTGFLDMILDYIQPHTKDDALNEDLEEL